MHTQFAITKSHTKRTMIIAIVAVSIIAICGVACYYPLRAIVWHAKNGNEVAIAGLKYKLPLFWWRGPDESDGTIVIRHARKAVSFTNSVTFRIGPVHHILSDDQVAAVWSKLGARAKNDHGAPVPFTLARKGGTLYCSKSGTEGSIRVLTCHDPQIPLGIVFVGAPDEEMAVESMISSAR